MYNVFNGGVFPVMKGGAVKIPMYIFLQSKKSSGPIISHGFWCIFHSNFRISQLFHEQKIETWGHTFYFMSRGVNRWPLEKRVTFWPLDLMEKRGRAFQ